MFALPMAKLAGVQATTARWIIIAAEHQPPP
jgi:hypothetical protein